MLSFNTLSNDMRCALQRVSELLHDHQGKWLVGGSCGLILQHIALEAQPRDLDIYADETEIRAIAESLADYVIHEPHYSETSIYRSNLSHYLIGDVQIELVGCFEVMSEDSVYRVEINDVLSPARIDYMIDGWYIGLTPLAHELVFNLLRGRVDRYVPIAEAMKVRSDAAMPVLQHIIQKNHLSTMHLLQLERLLDMPLRRPQ